MKSWEPVIPSSILIRCILERILQKAIFRVLKKNTGEWTGGAYGWFSKLTKNNCIWSALCMINGQYRGTFAEACRITFSMGEAFCRESKTALYWSGGTSKIQPLQKTFGAWSG